MTTPPRVRIYRKKRSESVLGVQDDAGKRAAEAANKQALPVPAYRLGSNKSQWFLDASKLAAYIDLKKVQAEQEWRAVRC